MSRLGSLKKPWFIGLLIFLSLIGVYYVARRIDWAVVGEINSWLLGVLLVVSVLYMLVNALSTWVLLRGMGYAPHFGRLYLVVTAGLSTNYITPVKAGIPVRLWLYKSLLEIPVSSGSASVVIETTLGMCIGAILSLWGIQSALRQYDIRIYLLALSIIAAGGAVSLFFYPQLLKAFGKLLPSRHADRINGWAKRFFESIKTIPGWTLVKVIFLYLVRVAARAFCLFFILRDMQVSVSVLDLVFVQSISGILGILSMLPMGIGVKDASQVVLMTQLGVPQSEALIAALIDRALWTFVPLVAGIISVNILGVNELLRRERGNP